MAPVHREEVVWQERVAGEVEKIRSKNQERRQEDILRAWRGNRSKINGMMRKRYGEGEWEVSENTVGSNKSKATVWTEGLHDKSRKRQEVELMDMPKVIQPPTMLTWAPIERNVLVENGQQSNIPYFGDEVIDRDPKFISGLVEEVNHKMSMSENLTDELFLPLAEALTKYDERTINSKYVVLFKPDSEREKEWVKSSRTDLTLPGLIVFQAIASKFPEFGTTDELIGKYRQLTAQAKRSDFVANLDSVEAASMGADRALHSYKLLLCRRCFLYDCPLHSDPQVDDAAPKLTEQEELSLPSTPCSKDCFRHLPGALAALSPRTPRTASSRPVSNNTSTLRPELCDELNPLRGITGTEKDVWTPAEETFFRVLAQSFPSNWCVIAQAMITKKCRQVYQFSLTDAGPRVKRSRGAATKPAKPKKVTTKAKQAALYKGHSEGGERENNRTYSPCHHPGQPCKEDVCSCRQVGNFCEKFCYCSIDCTHRFPGCKCKKQCITNACACYLASRECDPDLCTTCLDSSLELNPASSSCRNVVLQRRMGKKLYVAPSDIAGWGCYIGEKAAKNEFIAEYVGEMISQEESERRGKVYDKAKCSYMFNLNEDFCVDAARMGGKIRFANHSSKPNCKVKILVVAGDHRIGIYANKNIDVGEELFFNYGSDFHGHDIV